MEYALNPMEDFTLPLGVRLDIYDQMRHPTLEDLITAETRAMQRVGIRGIWTAREKQQGVWVPVSRHKNLFTNYGLTALASAPGGQYTFPNYLGIDAGATTQNNSTLVGATSVTLAADPTMTGDTQLVLSVGLGNQEIVTFTSKATVSGGVQFTLSPACINSHTALDVATRQVNVNDTVTSLAPEQQYDPTYAPNTRLQSVAGYSGGVGNYVMQFYMTGNQATNVAFITVALCDTATIGTGNMHNGVVLGYTHSTTNDVEIDGSITLSNV